MFAARLPLRLALAALFLAGAAPARAQLGLDLGPSEQKEQPKKKKADKKKTTEKKKAEPKAKGKAPAKAAPAAAPAPAKAAPAAPAKAPPAAEEPVVPFPSEAAPPPVVPPTPPPPPPKPAQAPAKQEGLTVTGKGAGKAQLDAAKKLADDKAFDRAALAYHEILRDKSLAEAHDEARYQLAKLLLRLDLNYAALARFDEILQRGPGGSKYFYNALDGLFAVGKRIANERREASEGRGQEQVILSSVARFAGEKLPPEYQDRFNTLLARYYFERGRALAEAGQGAEARRSYDEARRLAGLVKPGAGTMPTGGEAPGAGDDENLHARARFIDGAVLYALGDKPASLEAFKDVIRLTNPRKTSRNDPALREAAFLQLARIHYEHRQNRYAIFYYGKMPWGEPLWLEGLWESSYAYYRIADYEKALGNLLTLHSPYFQDEYFPESYVLKAIIYFENCRYPEARAILEDFNGRYEPVYAELKTLTAQKGGTSAAFYERIGEGAKADAKAPAKSDHAAIMRKVLNIALTDKTIRRLDDTLDDIDREMDERLPARPPEFRSSALSAEILSQLKAQKGKLLDEAGARARQKLEVERDALRQFLEQALRIKIEVSRREREALEAALAAGGKVDLMRRYKFNTAVSDEHEYWPYEGEFWRDELGTYAYTLTKGCREGPPARAGAK
ncbi:MAG TPA: adventurous gliding motility protein GltC [Anaeromyxobacteraceae bacterium]|nr:adventurous gliding motility protein GltC [Anaeromyxobacteraceae bacterium]